MRDDRFCVYLTRSAERDLLSLRSTIRQAARIALLALEETPLAGRVLKGSLYGVRSLHFAAGGVVFRAAYTVETEERRCLVFIVGPRRGFYSKALRRAKALGKARRKG